MGGDTGLSLTRLRPPPTPTSGTPLFLVRFPLPPHLDGESPSYSTLPLSFRRDLSYLLKDERLPMVDPFW